MLSLAYGKPSTFLATDTRTSGFCNMMGIPYHAVQSYCDDEVLAELRVPQPGLDHFAATWRSLRSAMAGVLSANGLNHALTQRIQTALETPTDCSCRSEEADGRGVVGVPPPRFDGYEGCDKTGPNASI